MSSLQQIFPFNNALVRRFLNWKQGDEEDTWRNKAVDALIKKLRRQPDDQYNILQTVLQRKSEDTPCITLSRSQDGRLQVSHRKMLPHVMYCRIFRWPDLQSQHELRSVSTCQYPAHRREATKICINPYHYARVDHSIYPPVVTPRSTTEFANASPPPQSPMSPASSTYSQPQKTNSPPSYFNNSASLGSLGLAPQPAHHQAFQQENPVGVPYGEYGGGFVGKYSPGGAPHLAHQSQQQLMQQQQLSNYYSTGQSPLSEANWYPPTQSLKDAGNGDHPTVESPMQQYESQSPPPGYAARDQLSHVPMDATAGGDTESQHNGSQMTDEGQEHWCRITYAELNQKIGEPFKGSSQQVIVDGFTDPSVHNRRFSLGVLSNINRNSTIEMTRRAIRKGVCLENNDNHIYVKNLSESSIFFHSKNCNVENQLNQHAVVKIEPQGRQKIFDQRVFENLVQEAIHSEDGKTYERLFSLTEHCIIKMSFVKGWGSIYQRQDVTSTPCWIEIHLLKPYALIDQWLRQVGPPSCQITSTS